MQDVHVTPGYGPWKPTFSRSTTDWTQRGDMPKIEDDGGSSWKRLRSSPGLARDDDENCQTSNNASALPLPWQSDKSYQREDFGGMVQSPIHPVLSYAQQHKDPHTPSSDWNLAINWQQRYYSGRLSISTHTCLAHMPLQPDTIAFISADIHKVSNWLNKIYMSIHGCSLEIKSQIMLHHDIGAFLSRLCVNFPQVTMNHFVMVYIRSLHGDRNWTPSPPIPINAVPILTLTPQHLSPSASHPHHSCPHLHPIPTTPNPIHTVSHQQMLTSNIMYTSMT